MSSNNCSERGSKSAGSGYPLLAGALLPFALAFAAPAGAAIDLAGLQVAPQRGQSADQTRRDRYECHNWAVEQTGVTPLAAPRGDEKADADEKDARERRAERVNRVLTGAAIGAGLGGLARSTQHKDPSNGVLAGAAVGAAVGASTKRGRNREPVVEEDAEGNEYLRALSACLEGRGYSVALPSAEQEGRVAAAD
jgi:hypothetical protein